MSHVLHETNDWNEDLGNCIFFHFNNFEEPPEVLCSTPYSSDFEEEGGEYWTHFVTMNFNLIFEQAGATLGASKRGMSDVE